MSEEPAIAQKGAYQVELEAGKDYYWCACGRSKKQPFCDGSHQGSQFAPVKFTAESSGPAFLCGCKQSDDKPWCDGTHNVL